MTTPATETKSIGLPADARLSWFLLYHLDNFIVTRQLRSIYQDSTLWQLHLDEKTFFCLPGLAKTSPAPTQTATNHTTGPLAAITFSHPSTRLPQLWFAVVPGEIDCSKTDSYRLTNSFYLDYLKPALPSQLIFCSPAIRSHLDNFFLICTLPGLPSPSLHMAIHDFVLEEDIKPVHERHLQACQKDLQAYLSYSMTDSSTLGYCCKHAGIGKKLVSIFALHQDSFIVNPNILFFYINRDSCSSKITCDERIRVHLPGLITWTINL